MASRGRDYDRSAKQRSRSRTDAFLDALEGGHVREALGVFKPSSPSSTTPRPGSKSQNHRHQHHHPNNRGYDYYDEGPPRHSRYDDYYNHDNYYPSDQRQEQGANASYYRAHPAAPAAASRRRHRSAHSHSHSHPHPHSQPYSHSHYYHERPSHSHSHHNNTHTHSHGQSQSNHSRRRASSTGPGSGPDLKQAASAAVTAGLVEAWRSRHDTENRTRRVATAAIGAAATDSALEGRRDDRGGGNKGGKGKRRTVIESAVAGLVENRVINGPRR